VATATSNSTAWKRAGHKFEVVLTTDSLDEASLEADR
jgi:hypothetical protein